MRSGTSRTKETLTWHSAARRAPTLTSNGLIARNVRTGEVWRVPTTKAMEALRGPFRHSRPPSSLKRQVTARRQAASHAVSGAVSLEIDCTLVWRACARLFRAHARLTRRVLRATREGRPARAVCVLRRWWCCLFKMVWVLQVQMPPPCGLYLWMDFHNSPFLIW